MVAREQLFVITIAGCKRESTAPPQVPDNLKVPDGQRVLLEGFGKGVQIYDCPAQAGDPAKFVWTFKAPEANLTNEHGDASLKLRPPMAMTRIGASW